MPTISYGAEFIADDSGKWCGNAVRLATREEAEGYKRHKESAWTSVRMARVVETDDPVNYAWVGGQLEPAGA